ncbi:MAG: arsenate reductase ArsC [Candidatus Nitrosopelagicus sp.]|nr:arsenate reductase ArsC [Candidatus Nitrosopelagicus sp.]
MKKVLFVCVENAGRSQMAEGFFRKIAPDAYQGISAGTKPVSEINPLAIQAMKEVDIDISQNQSKLITNEMISESNSVVNMGCMDKESCPALFVEDMADWDIEDPKGKSIEDVRRIRDSIELKVKELVSNL